MVHKRGESQTRPSQEASEGQGNKWPLALGPRGDQKSMGEKDRKVILIIITVQCGMCSMNIHECFSPWNFSGRSVTQLGGNTSGDPSIRWEFH